VEAVEQAAGRVGAALPALAAIMKVDKSSAQRRARQAASLGYIKNLEERRGQPARYVMGEPLPERLTILPTPQVLRQRIAALR
jgi:hypothetical protein